MFVHTMIQKKNLYRHVSNVTLSAAQACKILNMSECILGLTTMSKVIGSALIGTDDCPSSHHANTTKPIKPTTDKITLTGVRIHASVGHFVVIQTMNASVVSTAVMKGAKNVKAQNDARRYASEVRGDSSLF